MKNKNQIEIENCLTSDLRNMVVEFDNKSLTEDAIFSYFRQFLIDAKVDSQIVVNVLEQFGETGKHEARVIKVQEGW